MNYFRIFLAALAAWLVFFTYGFLVHGLLLAEDYTPYPVGVYRAAEDGRSHMPIGLLGIFVAILVFAMIYAKGYVGKHHPLTGARLGFLFGVFLVGAFVAVNYGTIHISGRLALELAVSEPIEWTLVGAMVGLIYRPAQPALN
jgi:hypothetical protein